MYLFFAALSLSMVTGLVPCGGIVNEQCWDNAQSNVTNDLTESSVWTNGDTSSFWSLVVSGDCRAYIKTAEWQNRAQGQTADHVITSNATTPFYFFGWGCASNRVTRQPALVVTGDPNIYIVEVDLRPLTVSPTPAPSSTPTLVPTDFPTNVPTVAPSRAPTGVPSHAPSLPPTTHPSFSPSTYPSRTPSTEPTSVPSASPTSAPSQVPSNIPTVPPSGAPTTSPTLPPTKSCIGTLSVISISGRNSDRKWDGAYEVIGGTTTRPFFKAIDGKTIEWKNKTQTWEIISGPDIISFGYKPRSSVLNFWPPRTQESWNRTGGNGTVTITLLCKGDPLRTSGQQLTTFDIFAQLQDVGFYLPLSMFSFAFGTVLIAYLYQQCHPGSDPIRWISCFRYFLQVFDLVTDVLFAYQLLALGMRWLFFASATFIVVPYLLSFIMLGYLIHQWRGIDSGSVSQYLQRFDWVLFLFCGLSGGCHAAVSIANSKMFFHKFFNMGLRRHDMLRMGKWKLWSTTMTENIPQVVIQTIYFVRVGVFGDVTDYIGIAAFSMTFISLVMTSATQLTRCSRKDELLYTDGLHFLLAFQSSKLRLWHRFSEKNMARIVAHYLGISSSSVEIYDVHTMAYSGTKGLRFAGVVGGLPTTLVTIEQSMRGLDTDKDKFIEGLVTGFALGSVEEDRIIESLEVEWVHVDNFDSNFSIASLGDKNIQMKFWDDLHSTSEPVSLDSPHGFAQVRAKLSNRDLTPSVEISTSIPRGLSNLMLRAQTPDPEMKPRERSGPTSYYDGTKSSKHLK